MKRPRVDVNLEELDQIIDRGAILSHAYEVGTLEAADIAEEMMRVAMILTDEDVVVLRAIYQGLAPSYNVVRGEVDFHQANDFWRLLDPTHRSFGEREFPELNGLSPGELKGTCGKLQSLGLLAQVERENSKVSPDIAVYTVIKRTKDFVDYTCATRCASPVAGTSGSVRPSA